VDVSQSAGRLLIRPVAQHRLAITDVRASSLGNNSGCIGGNRGRRCVVYKSLPIIMLVSHENVGLLWFLAHER